MPPKKTKRTGESGSGGASTTAVVLTGQPLSDVKLSLPTFLQIFQKSGGMSITDAMSVAKKIYPTHHSPALLAELTAVRLIELKVDSQDQRKTVLAAIRKAGYVKPAPPKVRPKGKDKGEEGDGTAENEAGPSEPDPPSPAKKRKRPSDDHAGELEPNDSDTAFNFREELNEEALRTKSTVINRAPVMTAWATIVAERLGFRREEALSIGSVYTEMNASSKGISLGIFDESKNHDYEAGSTQPFVELMGRKIPVLEGEAGEWRGIIKGSPVEPKSPFGYIQRSFRQTMPWAMGAMRLLADSFDDSAELNKRGYDLYCKFRPENERWGKKTEMRMESILQLRSKKSVRSSDTGAGT